MTPLPSSVLLACAVHTAQAAGNHALQNAHRRKEIVKTLHHDIKLRLDLECQAVAENVIRSTFPDHAILGEESVDPVTPAESSYQWIVDPIDGTINFSHGLPLWCCSVAVRCQDQVIAGAVFAPAMNELYTATIDSPSQCNGAPIHVSDESDIHRALIHTGVDRDYDTLKKPFAVFERIALQTQRPRVTGTAAYDICQVAAGHCDGYFEAHIYIWDIAAAGLIVQQAGGKSEMLTHPGRDHRLAFTATNSLLHDALKTLINP